MKASQLTFDGKNWANTSKEEQKPNPDLILCFGNKTLLKHPNGYNYLLNLYSFSVC